MKRRTLAERIAAGEVNQEERLRKMQEHAANMRAIRAAKRAANHTCPPSDTDRELTTLYATLDRVAPANIAPIPIATMLEDGQWTVDVNVRIRGVTDYEVSGSGKTLANAIANASRALANQADNERKATRNATRYGYTV